MPVELSPINNLTIEKYDKSYRWDIKVLTSPENYFYIPNRFWLTCFER